MNSLKFVLNGSWASPTVLSDETLFLGYLVLTLVVELGVFAFYSLVTDKSPKETVGLFVILLVANICSFLIGFFFTFMR